VVFFELVTLEIPFNTSNEIIDDKKMPDLNLIVDKFFKEKINM